jgi:hypothetical protein
MYIFTPTTGVFSDLEPSDYESIVSDSAESQSIYEDLRSIRIRETAAGALTQRLSDALALFGQEFPKIFLVYKAQAVDLFRIFAITFPLYLRNAWYSSKHLNISWSNLSLPLSLRIRIGRLVIYRVHKSLSLSMSGKIMPLLNISITKLTFCYRR